MDTKAVNNQNKTGENDEWEYTSNEEFNSISQNDLNVEVVGLVEKINPSKHVGKDKQYMVMTFVINNASGSRCTVCAWNQEIKKIEFNLQINSVIRIEGAKPIKIKYPQFNVGNVNYELKILMKTEIITLKTEEKNINLLPQLNVVSINNLKNEHGYVKIEGYVKTSFRLLEYTANDEKIKYGVGSITDGEWKVEIRINKFQDEPLFDKGTNVSVIGNIKTSNNNLVFISVEDLSCIQLISDRRLPFLDIFSGFKPVLKTLVKY